MMGMLLEYYNGGMETVGYHWASSKVKLVVQ